ncbi:MAG: hypothetical protein AAFZ65_14315, partial [Planctomycetota bacterium]
MFLSLPLALATSLGPQGTLTQNFNQQLQSPEVSSNPRLFDGLAAKMLFVAQTPPLGTEPWVSDGTEGGTLLLADLVPGSAGSNVREVVRLDDSRILFVPDSSTVGSEVFITDGTPAGTQLLVDLSTGFSGSEPSSLTLHNGEVYFFTTPSGSEAPGLWKTDGTAAGTQLVVSAESAFFAPGVPQITSTSFGLFYATAESGGWELWRTDGTPGGESLVQSTPAFPFGGLQQFTEVNGALYFTAPHPTAGRELWRTDGTVVGTGVLDLNPGPANSELKELTAFGDELFFTATVGESKNQLWKSDGTPGGTVQVLNQSATFPFIGPDPKELTVFNGALYFVASVGNVGTELFVTDGQVGNAALVSNLWPGPEGIDIFGLTVFNGEIYFSGETPEFGRELMATNGTANGVRLVADLAPGTDWSYPLGFVEVDGKLLFAADGASFGRELWRTDGTLGGTELVKNIAPPTSDGDALPRDPIAIGSDALLYLDDGLTGWEPYGVASGLGVINSLGDFNPGLESSLADRPQRFEGFGIFATKDTGSPLNRALWRTDGTSEGTQLLVDLAFKFFPDPAILGEFGGELYFGGELGGLGGELCVTDGTPEGTRLFLDIAPGESEASSPEGFAVDGDRFYFTARTPETGRELFVSDGTPEGTQLVVDLLPGAFSGAVSAEGSYPIQTLGGRVFYTGRNVDFEDSLHHIDGPGGTPVAIVTNPDGSSQPTGMTLLADRLLFFSRTSNSTRELFAVDGATFEVTQLTPFPGTTSFLIADRLQVVGEVAYGMYSDGVLGSNVLFRTDGTVAGTSVVKVLDPAGIAPLNLAFGPVTTDGQIVFRGDDHAFGSEVWVTDGTASGTARLTDINLGGADADPDSFVRAGSRLFFAATDGITGVELHSLPITATGGWIAEPYGSGCAGTLGEPQVDFSGEARIGAPFTVELTQAAPSSTAFLYLDLAGRPMDLGAGCSVYLPNPILSG